MALKAEPQRQKQTKTSDPPFSLQNSIQLDIQLQSIDN